MTHPPPRSTLFPYTTLFRSSCKPPKNDVTVLDIHDEANVDVEDRKSTRLNSSHLVISYAVFCLKKKKTREGIEKKHHRLDVNDKYISKEQVSEVDKDVR